jgi:hypothetical protein
VGTYQPTILSHNNVLTHGTIQMLPCGRTYYYRMAMYNVTMWQHSYGATC